MREWKIYTPTTDIDGSVNWHVNGNQVNLVRYHSTYNLYKFYEWDGGVRAMAMEFDNSLSLLADYFEEQPTKEQLDKRECNCWKFHVAFASEVSMRREIIGSQEIELWLAYKDKQYSEEDALSELLDRLSLPISIKKSNSDNDEYVWKFLDGKGIGYSFSDALKNALEYNMFKLRSHKIFR